MSSLANVRDLDCVKSFSPLVLGLSSREVTGAAAVLRRILYRWCLRRGSLFYATDIGVVRPLLELEGVTFDADDVEAYAASLRREASEEDFVLNAAVTCSLSGAGIAGVAGAILLVDGKTYPLEVDVSGAQAALLAIGGGV